MRGIFKHKPGEVLNGFELLEIWRLNLHTYGLFICPHCGVDFITTINQVKSGKAKSCGCIRGELISEAMQGTYRGLIHGDRYTKLYRKWASMKHRCNAPSYPQYEKYHSLGYYPGWDTFETWKDYVTNLQSYPGVGLIETQDWNLHRINNTVGYFPSNVKWLSQEEHQALHRERRKS